MIELTLFPSNKKHKYNTKTKALKEVKSNGLKSYSYILEDINNNTTYKSGLWLTEEELEVVRGFKTISKGIRYIKYLRKNNK